MKNTGMNMVKNNNKFLKKLTEEFGKGFSESIVTWFNYLQLMRIGKVEVGRVMNLSGTLV